MDASGNYGYKKAGADTVTPFRSKPLIFTTSPVDIKAVLPDVYNKLNADDFMVGGQGSDSYVHGTGAGCGYGVQGSCSKAYDQSTGILTFAEVSGYKKWEDWNDKVNLYSKPINLFAVWKGTIGGK